MKLLNLLPPAKQRYVKNLYLFLFVRIIFVVLLIGTIIISAGLLTASHILNMSILEVSKYSHTIDQELTSTNKEIQHINAELTHINFVLAKRKEWTAVIQPILAHITPPQITLSALNIDSNDKTILLEGKAQNRDALLSLEAALKQLPFVQDAQTPLENLIQQNNLEFQLTISLK